jgi:feruloyl esterase
MMRRMMILAALFLFSPASPAHAATSCENLRQLFAPGVHVLAAQRVEAGRFSPAEGERQTPAQKQLFQSLPAFCRVVASATPSNDSDIRIEVWLPESNWNGRLQAVGDGGLAGYIPFALMAPALADGYATAGTDTGHAGGNADFMPQHIEKLIDFAYRSTHELATTGKAIVESFYGRAPEFSYYNACSGGGRHAITSAQRYPADFNGIVAGAATWNQARLDAGRIGINLKLKRTPESQIPASKYPMIHDAVLEACDGLDGVRDGVLEDPRACRFDYATLTCTGADSPSCLTPAQVASAKTLTSPFKDASSGSVLLDVHLRPGTELQWGTLGGPEPLANSIARVRNFHLKDPAFQFRLATIGADIDRAARMDGGLLASNNFDLKPFFDRGGKLLMWHGWSDPQVPADNSIEYFESVLRAVGVQARNSIELFMLPGVLHCGGGPGPDSFDKMAPIVDWVENGKKPARIVAARRAGGRVVQTRPLCPFGSVAKYSGSGDTNDAANFTCVASEAVGSDRPER